MKNGIEKYDVSKKVSSGALDCDIQFRLVPMRDGVKLATAVYLPPGGGRHNVVLTRTPYDHRDRLNAPDRKYLEEGLIFIAQSCRGNGLSEDIFHPAKYERQDAEDTFAWIKKQPWFGGRIAMTGGSYSGFTQWMAAIDAGSELVGFCATVSTSDFHDKMFVGGAFFLQLHMHWGMTMNYRSRFGNSGIPDWDALQLAWSLPLLSMDEAAGLGKLPFWREWIERCSDEEFWSPFSIRRNYSKIKVPVFMTGGWFDFYTSGTLENFLGMRKQGGSAKARSFTRCVIGPWVHIGLINKDLFGEEAGTAQAEADLATFRSNVLAKPDADPLPGAAPLRYFMMGANEWREADEWPPQGVENTEFFLHSNGDANSRFGAGRLDRVKPDAEAPDIYLYDPRNPVTSRGGCFLGPGENGCLDQRAIEERSDVLAFVSAPLEEEFEIAGQVIVRLFASSDALDTDFTAKIVDIFPDGRSFNLCDGIIRARFRHSPYKPELLTPGKIYEYEIDCWHTANRFRKGHRIGVDISSSNFPRFDRNPNTGHAFGADADLKIARQTIHHDAEHPSRLFFPILRKGREMLQLW